MIPAPPTDDASTDDSLTVAVPDTIRRDERFVPRIEGLEPGAQVVLSVQTDDETPWSSTATFEANASGTVDTAETPPVAGDYATADPMGPVWSMTPPETTEPDHRYWMPPLGAHELRYRAVADGGEATATVTVRHADPGVEANDPGETGPAGTWYEPAGEGPHPPVVVLHGSGGDDVRPVAALLASEGFAAFALQYLGTRDLPERPTSVPLEYVEDAVDWFLERDAVADGSYGVHGVSMGAQLAFVLASRDDRVGAVVSDSGNHVCFETGDGSAWAEDGGDLPRIGVPEASPDAWDRPVGEHGVDRSGMWLGMLDAETTATRRTATLPVEESGAAFCLLSGGEDPQWPAVTFHHMLLARLDALAYDARTEHHWYQQAGHGIGAPHEPTTYRPAAGEGIAPGGQPEAHAAAQADAWPRVLAFLRETLEG